MRLQRVDIRERAHGEDARQIAPDVGGQAARRRPGGEDDGIAGFSPARVGQGHCDRVQRGDPGAGVNLHPLVVIEGCGPQMQPVARHLAQQVGLGQRRALIRQFRLIPPKGQASVEALLAQRLDQGGPGLTGTDYGNVLHVVPSGRLLTDSYIPASETSNARNHPWPYPKVTDCPIRS